MNYINMGGSDPLLGPNPYLSQNPVEVDAQIEVLRQRQQALEQQRQAISNQAQNPASQQSHASRTPIWDEIDKMVDSFSDSELEMIGQNPEYQQSNDAIMGILNREYLRIMRPQVESSQDGKEALDKHLDLIKKLKKSVNDEAAKSQALFNEYISNYSDMPYAEFLKIKKGGKKK